MKCIKKMLAALVACTMVMTLLTACGGASNGKGNPMLDAVNEILKSSGSKVVLEYSPELTCAAEEFAQLDQELDAGKIDEETHDKNLGMLAEKYGKYSKDGQIDVCETSAATDAACAADLAKHVRNDYTKAGFAVANLSEGRVLYMVCD